jgi:hypothetical protein
MIDAMQMTVSKEIEKRIDETSSTRSRTGRDLARTAMPDVVTGIWRAGGCDRSRSTGEEARVAVAQRRPAM